MLPGFGKQPSVCAAPLRLSVLLINYDEHFCLSRQQGERDFSREKGWHQRPCGNLPSPSFHGAGCCPGPHSTPLRCLALGAALPFLPLPRG